MNLHINLILSIVISLLYFIQALSPSNPQAFTNTFPLLESNFTPGKSNLLHQMSSPVSIPTPPSYWKRIESPVLPPPRSRAAFILHPPNNTGLLFGGYSSTSGLLNDFWSFDGSIWTELHPANSPPARADAVMAFDPVNASVVLFGGTGNDGIFGDTWLFDGTDWIEQHPENSPSARFGASMVFDMTNEEIILFGGMTGSGEPSNQMWTWDGVNWQQEFPANLPSARWGASMVYDPTNGSVLLFGGSAADAQLDDTWQWDGTNWVEQISKVRPDPRTQHGMVYDPDREQVILFGGIPSTDIVPTDTWVWDGQSWTQLYTTFEPPDGMAYGADLVYLPVLKTIIVYNSITDKITRPEGMFYYSEHSDIWVLNDHRLIYFSYFDSFSVR